MEEVEGDTKFSAAARQLQNDWRIKNNYPIGTYKNKKGEKIELGNYVEEKYAFENGVNFLTNNIRKVVETTLANKEIGAVITKPRLYTNLLSSQPLAFNLFAELSLDYELATIFFDKLFPNRIEKVTNIIFEHSPGRGDVKFTNDSSAFDVFIEYSKGDILGFIGIEVKYSESLNDSPSSHKSRYEEIANSSKLFRKDSLNSLMQKPLQQIWRDHLLSIVTKQVYKEGFFVFLFPKGNSQCQNGVNNYIKHLISDKEEETGFYPRYLEDIIQHLGQQIQQDWTKELALRYLGNGIV